MFQYLGSRGAQLPSALICRSVKTVSILGLARSPTRPSAIFVWLMDVSILGLARSPTRGKDGRFSAEPFQYLGSRGAQRRRRRQISIKARFNTWAREEPNDPQSLDVWHLSQFQYLGSRGAQLNCRFKPTFRLPFQYLGSRGTQLLVLCNPVGLPLVSILGLARSPTTSSGA